MAKVGLNQCCSQTGNGVPAAGAVPIPGSVQNLWMWHLGTTWAGGHRGAGLTLGLDALGIIKVGKDL